MGLRTGSMLTKSALRSDLNYKSIWYNTKMAPQIAKRMVAYNEVLLPLRLLLWLSWHSQVLHC